DCSTTTIRSSATRANASSPWLPLGPTRSTVAPGDPAADLRIATCEKRGPVCGRRRRLRLLPGLPVAAEPVRRVRLPLRLAAPSRGTGALSRLLRVHHPGSPVLLRRRIRVDGSLPPRGPRGDGRGERTGCVAPLLARASRCGRRRGGRVGADLRRGLPVRVAAGESSLAHDVPVS